MTENNEEKYMFGTFENRDELRDNYAADTLGNFEDDYKAILKGDYRAWRRFRHFLDDEYDFWQKVENENTVAFKTANRVMEMISGDASEPGSLYESLKKALDTRAAQSREFWRIADRIDES